MAPRDHRCVRCGRRPPCPDLYLCAECARDPMAEYERRTVEEHVEGYRDQRRALVGAMHWAGGWWEVPRWP